MTNTQQLAVLKKHPSLAFYAAFQGINIARAKHFRREIYLDEPCCFSMQYLYPLMRDLKPSIVVETGVRTGVSSAFILKALTENGKGMLFSIDLPNPNPSDQEMQLPKDTWTGFYVNLFPEFRKRWNLILGDSKVELPKLMNNLSIDAFHHDSDHNYDHMMFEFETVWPHLRKGGVLLADDVERHLAFQDFCKSVGIEPIITKSQTESFDNRKGMAIKQ